MSNNSVFIDNATYNPYEDVTTPRKIDSLIIPDMAVFQYKFGNLPKEPAIYKIKIAKDASGNKSFKLVKDSDRFKLRKKHYGNLVKDADRTWRTYNLFKESGEKQFAFGAVGFKGMGKTEFLSIVANRAMDEEGMICVLVTEIQSSPELIQFLSSLDNAFIMFDEFGKVFPPRGPQNLMLTMFNNLNQKHRIIAASDNSLDAFDEFFKDRTGRIYYLFEFYSIDQDIISEYAKDAGASPEFIKEIIKASKRVANFSMDYIQGLVKEHKWYPNDSLEDILYYLNLKVLRHRVMVHVDKVEKIVKDEKTGKEEYREMNFTCNRSGDMLKQDFFNKGYSLYINISGFKPTKEELEAKLKAMEEASKESKGNAPMGFGSSPFNQRGMAPFGSGGPDNDNLYLDNEDEIVNKSLDGEIEYYTFALKDYLVHIRIQEKK